MLLVLQHKCSTTAVSLTRLQSPLQIASTASYISRAHKLAPLCALIFHSSVQHPLLAGALAQLAEDQGNCAYIASVRHSAMCDTAKQQYCCTCTAHQNKFGSR